MGKETGNEDSAQSKAVDLPRNALKPAMMVRFCIPAEPHPGRCTAERASCCYGSAFSKRYEEQGQHAKRGRTPSLLWRDILTSRLQKRTGAKIMELKPLPRAEKMPAFIDTAATGAQAHPPATSWRLLKVHEVDLRPPMRM